MPAFATIIVLLGLLISDILSWNSTANKNVRAPRSPCIRVFLRRDAGGGNSDAQPLTASSLTTTIRFLWTGVVYVLDGLTETKKIPKLPSTVLQKLRSGVRFFVVLIAVFCSNAEQLLSSRT